MSDRYRERKFTVPVALPLMTYLTVLVPTVPKYNPVVKTKETNVIATENETGNRLFDPCLHLGIIITHLYDHYHRLMLYFPCLKRSFINLLVGLCDCSSGHLHELCHDKY